MAENLKTFVMKTLRNKLLILVLLILIPSIFIAMELVEPSDILIYIPLAIVLAIIIYQFSISLRLIDFDAYGEARKAEMTEERRRARKAREKFRTPLLGHILRWMYREGWFYSTAVILLILTGIFLRFHALGDFDFRDDEYPHFSTAVGYLKTGEFVRWNFLDDSPGEGYTRAWPFTWQVAQSFKIFGVSRFSGRLISFLWGVLFLPLIYLITKRITNSKKVALLTLLLIALDPYLIFLSRWTRMYQTFVVLFFLMVYFFYRGFEYQYIEKAGDNRLMKWFYKNDMNPIYLSISIIIFFISLNVHDLSLFFPLGIAFYALSMLFKKFLSSRCLKFDKYLVTIFLSSIAFIFLLSFCSFFGQNLSFCRNIDKTTDRVVFNYSTIYPLSAIYCILGSFSMPVGAFFVIGLVYGLFKDSKTLLYYSSFILSISLFFLFFSYRPLNPRYLSEIMLFMCIFASLGLIAIMESLSSKMDAKRRKHLWVMFAIFIIIICSMTLLDYKNLDLIGGYVKSNRRGNFKTVSEYLGENYREGEIVLDISPIDYYLRDYRDKNIHIVHLHSNRNDLHSNRNDLQRDILDYHERYKSGWLIFEKVKSWHFNKETLQYIRENFDYVEELNDTNIEVYRW